MAAPVSIGVIQTALAWHRHRLRTHPYVTNSVQAGVLMLFGDRAAQHFEQHQRGQAYNTKDSLVRSATVTSWAMSINACFWTFWYSMLARRFPAPPTSAPLLQKLRAVVPSVGLSACLSPFWNAAFFTYSTTLEFLALTPQPLSAAGRKELKARVTGKLEKQLLPTVMRSASIWIPFNFINLSLVPLEYRMVAGGAVALCWNMALSLIQHAEEGHGQHGDQSHAAVPARIHSSLDAVLTEGVQQVSPLADGASHSG